MCHIRHLAENARASRYGVERQSGRTRGSIFKLSRISHASRWTAADASGPKATSTSKWRSPSLNPNQWSVKR
jgi:hypothetical protein